MNVFAFEKSLKNTLITGRPAIHTRNRIIAAISVFLLSIILGVEGAVFRVNDTNDTLSVRSLRGAILQANSLGGYNIIVLTQTNYVLMIQGVDEVVGRTGDLDITRGSLTIIGLQNNVRIDASGLGDRIFHVHAGARVTLSRLSLSGGSSSAGTYGKWRHRDGKPAGAILNEGSLNLVRCTVLQNSTGAGAGDSGGNSVGVAGAGGGIYNRGTLTMRYCVLSDNTAGPRDWPDYNSGGEGGGIYNRGICVLDDSVIANNASGSGPDLYDLALRSGGNGGGVLNAGRMLLNRCAIVGNRTGFGGNGRSMGDGAGAGGNGAGICNSGTLKVNFCVLAANLTGSGGNGATWSGFGGALGQNGREAGAGGGLWNGGRCAINTCTVSSNMSGNGGQGGPGAPAGAGGNGGDGAGIANSGFLSLVSSTVTDNLTGNGGNGGAAEAYWQSQMLGGPGGTGGTGAGLAVRTNDSVVQLANTIIALNSLGAGGAGGKSLLQFPPGTNGAPGFAPDIAGTIYTRGYNLIGVLDTNCVLNGETGLDLTGTINAPLDPMLGPLQDNDGPTFTHALLPGSPAIDKGKCFGVKTDQRGKRRPRVYPTIVEPPGGDGTDIGAFEVQPVP